MARNVLLDTISRILRRRKRDEALNLARSWPLFPAKLLKDKAVVLEKDLLAEDGTAFQDRQIECPFYFTLNGDFYGGHLRSTPVSDSEGHRLIRQISEETQVQVRYNPANPDQTHTFPEDNPNTFPFAIWPS